VTRVVVVGVGGGAGPGGPWEVLPKGMPLEEPCLVLPTSSPLLATSDPGIQLHISDVA